MARYSQELADVERVWSELGYNSDGSRSGSSGNGNGGNGGGSNGYDGGTRLKNIAGVGKPLAGLSSDDARAETRAKQYLSQAMPSINFAQYRAEMSGPIGQAVNEKTQEEAKARYETASAQYENKSKQLDKLLAQTGDYAGYGADLEKAKTSTADAKAKMEEAADAYRALGGTIEADNNQRVGKTIAGGAENYLASLLGAVGSYHEGGVRGSKAQIERDLADLQTQADKAQQAFDEMLAKYGDENNVNVKAAASALAEIKSNQELYQGMLDNQSLERTSQAIYGASDRMAERGAQNIAEAKEGLGAGGQFLVDTGAAGVQLLGDIALGKVTGLGMMPVMGARSYGGGANEARQAGATYEQQFLAGGATAAVEMLTEKLADGLAGVAGKGAADDAAKEIIRKWAKTDAGRTALRAVYGITGEAGEEAISTLVSPLIERIYNDEALKESYGTAEGRKQLLNEALHDALVGGALGGLGTLGSFGNGQNAAELADMRMRDASKGDVQSQTNNAFDVLFGNMSPEQSQAREAAALAQINANQQAAPAPAVQEAPAPVAQETTGQDALLEAAGITPAAQEDTPAPVETAPAVEQPAPVESAPEQTPEAQQAEAATEEQPQPTAEQPTAEQTQEATAEQPAQEAQPAQAGQTTAESTNGEGPVRERGMAENLRNNDKADPALRESFEQQRETYTQLTNSEVVQKADAIISEGFDAAKSTVQKAIGAAKAGAKFAPEMAVAGYQLANEMSKRGDIDGARELCADIAAELTYAGQLGQIGRVIIAFDSNVRIRTVQKLVDRLSKNLTGKQRQKNIDRGRGDAEGKISVDKDLLDAYANAETEEAADAALDAIKDDIAAQIPSTFRDKFTALRYLNMLGNLKTQGRNLIGNTAMMAATNVKYTLQAVNELVASAVSGGKYKRNTALVTSAQLRQQAAQDFADNIDEIKGESKYSDVAKQASRDIEERRTIFDGILKPLEGYRKLTNWAMDAGDVIFMKAVYTRSFAGWMQAHGVTDVANATPDQVSRARAFATKEAQEATFHDSNAVSDAVTNFDAKLGPAGKALIQGVIPFRRTPANVAVRAIEYSPVGVAETIYKGIQAATGKGDATAADVINSLSKNVTGSALMLAGWFLAAAGMARGSNDDDKELSAFEKMQGAMDYSVKIGGRNVSLSQFAPMAIPFFMGVKLNELMERSDEPLSLDDAGDILGIVTDPMLEMSMLSGVNDFMNDLASLNGDTDAIPSLVANAALGYLSQGLTNSFLGQMEQANEENRQTTYTDTKSADATELDKRLGKYQRIVAKAAAKTPGIDYNQQDYVDAWGRTISNGGAAERYFNALLNPTYTSKENSTEVDAELERLYTDNKDVEGFPDVLPSKRPRSAAIGDGIVMTPDEYLQFSKDSGAKKLELVKDFMGSDQYKGLTDQQRADIISDLYSFADSVSLDKIKENYNISRPTDWDRVKELEDPVEYLTGKEILRQSGNEYKGTPDYSQIDSLLAGWGNLSADTQAELSKMANVNNMRYAYDQLGVGSGDYFDTKNTVTEAEKSQLGNKTGGAADAIVIAKTSGKTDEEKLAALEALNQPDKQTGKRAAVVRRFEAAAQYNIPFDQWAAFEAAVYDNAKNPASPSNQAIYAAEDAVGIKRGTGKAIWRKISGDENKVEMYDDYFSQYYEAPGQVSFTNYLANAAGLG